MIFALVPHIFVAHKLYVRVRTMHHAWTIVSCARSVSGVARNCLTVGHVRSDSMQSAPARGVWGHAHPDFFLNFRPSELLSGVFNECCGSLQ